MFVFSEVAQIDARASSFCPSRDLQFKTLQPENGKSHPRFEQPFPQKKRVALLVKRLVFQKQSRSWGGITRRLHRVQRRSNVGSCGLGVTAGIRLCGGLPHKRREDELAWLAQVLLAECARGEPPRSFRAYLIPAKPAAPRACDGGHPSPIFTCHVAVRGPCFRQQQHGISPVPESGILESVPLGWSERERTLSPR